MKISVAICTYNGGRFLEQQLKSIFMQTWPVDEVIICDDQSSDNTIEVIKRYGENYPDKIGYFINNNVLGPIKNFEKCIGVCSGDIIFLSDQDDIWYTNKVEKIVEAFKNDQKALLFFTNGDLIDERGETLSGTLWEKWKFVKKVQREWENNNNAFVSLLKNRNYITGATVAFRKELKNHIFPFQLPKGYWHDSWIGIVSAGLDGLRFLTSSTIYYRIHSYQQIGIGNGTQIVKGDSLFNNHISLDSYQQILFTKFPRKKRMIYHSSMISNLISKAKTILKV